jgi:small-conductance mechanosensitive channel
LGVFSGLQFLRFLLKEDVYFHLHLASGIPYAIFTVLHYVILLSGFFVALSALGIDLTKLTILVGAFTVGIGFGLQNVINNIVSGLILLFERPIKVGDVIEVGGNFGEVRHTQVCVTNFSAGAEPISFELGQIAGKTGLGCEAIFQLLRRMPLPARKFRSHDLAWESHEAKRS